MYIHTRLSWCSKYHRVRWQKHQACYSTKQLHVVVQENNPLLQFLFQEKKKILILKPQMFANVKFVKTDNTSFVQKRPIIVNYSKLGDRLKHS